MQSVRITHFSDVLCVWAYVSQIRCDELLSAFEGQVAMDCRFIHVFGSVRAKMHAQWAERGGVEGYAKHVQEIASQFDHVKLHPQVWVKNTPESSMPSHLLLCAVRELEAAGDAAPGSQARVAWAVRQAFFEQCEDVSARGGLLEIAEGCEVSVASLEKILESGVAHAALSSDLDEARDQFVRSSPTLLLNEGRQRLMGNVGYRVIEANVRELIERPGVQHSWC